MNMPEAVTFGTFAVTFFGVLWKISSNGEYRRKKIYETIEEEREKVDKDFTRKERCDLISQRLIADTKEIKADVKKLLSKNEIK